MTTALARTDDIPTERLGQIMVKSGFFRDTREEAQAIVKILYGRELNFGPIASMMGCHIIEGKLGLAAQLIAAAVQNSGVFKYRVREWNDTVCRIEFFERQESLGCSEFSIEDAARAQLAGKGNWAKYPKAMLWARAMSQGARAYTPSVFNGAVYTPDELGADADEDGRVVDTTTGEVLAEPDVDVVTSADEPIWQKYLAGLSMAQEFGLRTAPVVLPHDRADIIARVRRMGEVIRGRQAQLAEEDAARSEGKAEHDAEVEMVKSARHKVWQEYAGLIETAAAADIDVAPFRIELPPGGVPIEEVRAKIVAVQLAIDAAMPEQVEAEF